MWGYAAFSSVKYMTISKISLGAGLYSIWVLGNCDRHFLSDILEMKGLIKKRYYRMWVNFAQNVFFIHMLHRQALISVHVVNVWQNLLHLVTLIQPGSRLLSPPLPFKLPLTTPTHWGHQSASVKAKTLLNNWWCKSVCIIMNFLPPEAPSQ